MHNIDLNQGMPEYTQGDPLLSMSIEDISRMLGDEPLYIQSFDPIGQAGASSSGGGRGNTQNFNQGFTACQGSNYPNQQFFTPHQGNQQGYPVQQGNQQGYPVQSDRGERRQSLPPIIINERGGGRSRGRGRARETNASRGSRDRGKRVQLQPEPEEEDDFD
ncbi:hypothetical protein A2U01_0020559 [Trifolium medium]|uniref:Uncharacterized protein n=1 Tax=Trifolium medium TaxID=97028 RepID=A0A392NKC1_9FABA|nr:hypothetical protein [Trifolium medium]